MERSFRGNELDEGSIESNRENRGGKAIIAIEMLKLELTLGTGSTKELCLVLTPLCETRVDESCGCTDEVSFVQIFLTNSIPLLAH